PGLRRRFAFGYRSSAYNVHPDTPEAVLSYAQHRRPARLISRPTVVRFGVVQDDTPTRLGGLRAENKV
ncbi:MAG: hypothetical protein M3Q75_11710, partial [Gemmatimonadota bacterium]|nr:hypothetical protein [Gemmatimonadota bacterium]